MATPVTSAQCNVVRRNRQQASKRCGELGIAHFLSKPVRHLELVATVRRALGLAGSPTVSSSKATKKMPPLRVLLAEDNLVNQKLATRLLEKDGHTVTVVGNGRLAVDATLETTFDLALIDIQMPVMDGVQATKEIREIERSSGDHLPIIALTAHAMKGDREHFLSSGMDEYVSKPINIEGLNSAIEHVVVREIPTIGTAVPSVFDREKFLANLNNDLELFQELIDIFLEDRPRLADDLRSAVSEGNAEALRRSAHSLKGAVSNFTTGEAYTLLAELEDAGIKNRLDDTHILLERLGVNIAQLETELRGETTG